VVYNCNWSSPAQLFSDPIPAGLMTTLYCLRFGTPPTWRAMSANFFPEKQGVPVITLGTRFSFRRFVRLAGLRCRYSTPPPHGIFLVLRSVPSYNSSALIPRKIPSSVIKNACLLIRLPCCCLSMFICVIILNKRERTSRNVVGYAKLSELA
jgi:hypothetical protein